MNLQQCYIEIIERIIDCSVIPEGELIAVLDIDESLDFYDRIIINDAILLPDLPRMLKELDEYNAELLVAARLEIRESLEAIGGKIKDKHKCFSGLSRELNECGFQGNHALIVWGWLDIGDTSNLDAIEIKHEEIALDNAVNEQAIKNRKNKIKDKKANDKDRLTALIEHLGLDK